jgi:hypothetical protein
MLGSSASSQPNVSNSVSSYKLLFSGWLSKEEGIFLSWKLRYFLIIAAENIGEVMYFDKEIPSDELRTNSLKQLKSSNKFRGTIQLLHSDILSLPKSVDNAINYQLAIRPANNRSNVTVLTANSNEIRLKFIEAAMKAGAKAQQPQGRHSITINSPMSAQSTSNLCQSQPSSPQFTSRRPSAAENPPILPGASDAGLIITPDGAVEAKMWPNSTYEGFMHKLGRSLLSSWKLRYFILEGDSLVYFAEKKQATVKGIIDLEGADINLLTSSERLSTDLFSHKAFTLSIQPKIPVERFGLAALKRDILSIFTDDSKIKKYYVAAKSEAEMQIWLKLLRAAAAGENSNNSAENKQQNGQDGEEGEEEEKEEKEERQESETQATNSGATSVPSSSHPSTAPTSGPIKIHIHSADLLADRLYKLDETEEDPAKLFRARYFSLDLHSGILSFWRHRSQIGAETGRKQLDISGAIIQLEEEIKCEKNKENHCVLAIIPANNAFNSAQGKLGKYPLVLGCENRNKTSIWYSSLLVLANKSDNKPKIRVEEDSGSETEETSRNSSKNEQKTPRSTNNNTNFHYSANNFSKTTPDPISRSTNTSPAPENAESCAVDIPFPPVRAIRDTSELLSAMLDSLEGDCEGLSRFRQSCIDYHKNRIDSAAFFKGYFRSFGRDRGLFYWLEVLNMLSDGSKRSELESLLEAHKHLFLEAKPTSLSEKQLQREKESSAERSASSTSAPTSPTPVNNRSTNLSYANISSGSSSSLQATSTVQKNGAQTAFYPSCNNSNQSSAVNAVSISNESTECSAKVSPAVNAAISEKVECDVARWLKSSSKKSDVVSLLYNINIIFPTVSRETLGISKLSDYAPAQVKKFYMRSILLIHPDKHMQSSMETQLRAANAFQILNKYYTKLQKKLHKPA